MDVDLPPRLAPRARVHREDHGLGAEAEGQTLHERGVVDGGGVHRHLVRSRPQQRVGVLHRAHAPAHGEGKEDGVGDPPHHVDDDGPGVGGSGDVQEDQLVGALGVVARRALDRVSGVAQRHEAHALDHSAAIHVEARDEALGEHQATASFACASVSRLS